MHTQTDNGLFIGIDVGTSGCRAIAIDKDANVKAESAVSMQAPSRNGASIEQSPDTWWQALQTTLHSLMAKLAGHPVHALAIDGTSATVLLTDAEGRPLGPALMYNDARAEEEAKRIAALAPADCAAHGVTSALAKSLWLQQQAYAAHATHIMSQADWLAAKFTGLPGVSDENNCMKLGYDAVNHAWPDWLSTLGVQTAWLPQVKAAGSVIGNITAQAASDFGLNVDTRIVTGTTDSTAAFLATGAGQPGDAVTSLGSTLVVKAVSDQPVFASQYGIYSHPLGQHWLVGGASNSGGAVLLQHFSTKQLHQMTPALEPDRPTGLDYYPLPGIGERFPLNDPGMKPVLTPRPDDDVQFFQAMLEGIARIELNAYRKLESLGVAWPQTLRTIGGGSANPAWQRIRENLLGIPMLPTLHTQAAYGTALLARKGVTGITMDSAGEAK